MKPALFLTLTACSLAFTACSLNGLNAAVKRIDDDSQNGHLVKVEGMLPEGALGVVAPEQILVQDHTFSDHRINEWKISFLDITEKQFEGLMALYSGHSLHKSKISFDPEKRVYPLTDFLPPYYQALSGKRFEKGFWFSDLADIVFPGFSSIRTQRATTSINCWNTTWELTRIAKERDPKEQVFNSFHVPFEQILPQLTSDQTSSFLQYAETSSPADLSPLFPHERNQALQTGDYLLLSVIEASGRKRLEHTAIFIDTDVYFEKTAEGSDSKFRFVTYEAIVNLFNGRNQGLRTHVEWRRPKDTAFGHPFETLGGVVHLISATVPVGGQPKKFEFDKKFHVWGGGDGLASLSQIVEIPIVFDESGGTHTSPEYASDAPYELEPQFRQLLEEADTFPSGENVEMFLRGVNIPTF